MANVEDGVGDSFTWKQRGVVDEGCRIEITWGTYRISKRRISLLHFSYLRWRLRTINQSQPYATKAFTAIHRHSCVSSKTTNPRGSGVLQNDMIDLQQPDKRLNANGLDQGALSDLVLYSHTPWI